jgi:hypothetical protein
MPWGRVHLINRIRYALPYAVSELSLERAQVSALHQHQGLRAPLHCHGHASIGWAMSAGIDAWFSVLMSALLPPVRMTLNRPTSPVVPFL